MNNQLIFVFDVESIGLFGEPFAVGWVVQNLLGEELEEGYISFPSKYAQGTDSDRDWVERNVIPALPDSTIKGFDIINLRKTKPYLRLVDTQKCYSYVLRSQFWEAWKKWQIQKASIWADCSFPLESGFIRECINDAQEEREPIAPYPLHEVATALFLINKNPIGTHARLENELPKHHPTKDARQSARIIRNCLQQIKIP